MTIETRATTLFGGLARMQTLQAIESGCLTTSENASVLITKWQTNPIPAELDSESGFLWQTTRSPFGWHHHPVVFSPDEYNGSFIWYSNLVKKLIFYFVATWGQHGKLSQEKLCRACSQRNLSNSLVSSISANLNSGVAQGLYKKVGTGKEATYSLAEDFRSSKQLRQIRLIPSPNAVARVRARVRGNVAREV